MYTRAIVDVEPRPTANKKKKENEGKHLKNVLQFQSPFVDVGAGDIVALCIFKHQIQISVHLLHVLVFVILHLITENRKNS